MKYRDSQDVLRKHLIDIERKLWTNDQVVYKKNLSEDCLLVFPETGVITRDTAVSAILKENEEGRKWAEVNFDDVRNLNLADDVALLSYRVAARWEHDKVAIVALASSVYVKQDGVWRLVFHQQTPINADASERKGQK